MEIEKFDGMFMTCIQQVKGFDNFFNAIFGFLQRKTDFYKNISQSRIFIEYNFQKWLKKHKEKIEKEESKKQKIEEIKVKNETQKLNEIKLKPFEKSPVTIKEISSPEYEKKNKNEEQKPNYDYLGADDSDKLKEGHIMPNKENGASKEKYNWSQHDIKEITITTKVPVNIKSKNMKIETTNNHLYVGIIGQPPIIDSELWGKIKSDSLIWEMEEEKDYKLVTINFEKFTECWWEAVEKNDTVLIDLEKLTPEPSSVSDIKDPEFKAHVEKMLFDTRQKALGKQTSDEIKKASQIEDFIKQHPEMDFSKAKWK